MELSILLAKVFGIYLLVAGISMIIKRKSLIRAVDEMFDSVLPLYFAGIVELFSGLFLVFTHNIWESSWVVIITIIGWLALIEGGLYLILPNRIFARIVRPFNKKGWYIIGGLISIILGAYLVYVGFSA